MGFSGLAAKLVDCGSGQAVICAGRETPLLRRPGRWPGPPGN